MEPVPDRRRVSEVGPSYPDESEESDGLLRRIGLWANRNSDVLPTPESYEGKVDQLGPRSCYEEGKRFGEALCKAYSDQYGLDVRIARIFNSYGPRLRAEGAYGRVVSRFLLQALKGEDLTVFAVDVQKVAEAIGLNPRIE